MVFPKNAASLSLLLGASGAAVSAAATLPCRDAEHMPRTNAFSLETGCGAFGALDETRMAPRQAPGSVGSAPKADDSYTPQGHVITTKEVSRTGPFASRKISGIPQLSSPLKPDLNDPLGSVVDWLDPQQATNDIFEGELDLVAPTDEGPMAQKIGTLGYADENSGHNPFELWSEAETGSLVSLAPLELAQERKNAPDTGLSNHSMAMIVARAMPLGLLPDLNLTNNGAHSESAHPPNAPTTASLMTIRIKAGVSADKSELKENLCATYYNDWSQSDDWVPMRMQPCDDSYLSGSPSAPSGTSETQLWQYDPNTREVKPILLGVGSEAAPAGNHSPAASATLKSIHSSASTTEAVSAFVSSATDGKASVSLDNAHTHSAATAIISQKVRRNGDGNLATARKRDASAPPFMAVQVVDPYTLIFNPRTAVGADSISPHPSTD